MISITFPPPVSFLRHRRPPSKTLLILADHLSPDFHYRRICCRQPPPSSQFFPTITTIFKPTSNQILLTTTSMTFPTLSHWSPSTGTLPSHSLPFFANEHQWPHRVHLLTFVSTPQPASACSYTCSLSTCVVIPWKFEFRSLDRLSTSSSKAHNSKNMTSKILKLVWFVASLEYVYNSNVVFPT